MCAMWRCLLKHDKIFSLGHKASRSDEQVLHKDTYHIIMWLKHDKSLDKKTNHQCGLPDWFADSNAERKRARHPHVLGLNEEFIKTCFTQRKPPSFRAAEMPGEAKTASATEDRVLNDQIQLSKGRQRCSNLLSASSTKQTQHTSSMHKCNCARLTHMMLLTSV